MGVPKEFEGESLAILWPKVVTSELMNRPGWRVTACLPRSPKRKIFLRAVFIKRRMTGDSRQAPNFQQADFPLLTRPTSSKPFLDSSSLCTSDTTAALRVVARKATERGRLAVMRVRQRFPSDGECSAACSFRAFRVRFQHSLLTFWNSGTILDANRRTEK